MIELARAVIAPPLTICPAVFQRTGHDRGRHRIGGVVKAVGETDNMVTDRSVSPQGYGRFLIDVFEGWVRRDVADAYVPPPAPLPITMTSYRSLIR
jgi:sulfatase maturation enzyme AslB (radical SAM superfamily)